MSLKKEWWEDAFGKGWYPLESVTSSPAARAQTRREVLSLKRLLKLRRGERILDVACGTGRHAIPLAKAGFGVVGVDISPHYLRRARREAKRAGVTARFEREDMRRIGFVEEFDAAINIFTSFGYFATRRDDEKALRNVFRALRPGGRFVIEMFNIDWVKANFSANSWRELPDGTLILESRRFDDKRSLSFTSWIFISGTKRREMHSRARAYTAEELSRLLRRIGFREIACYADLSGGRFLGEKSRRMVLVARRELIVTGRTSNSRSGRRRALPRRT